MVIRLGTIRPQGRFSVWKEKVDTTHCGNSLKL